MKKDLEKERMIVDRISELIIPDYLNNAEAYKLTGQDIEIIPESVFYDMIKE